MVTGIDGQRIYTRNSGVWIIEAYRLEDRKIHLLHRHKSTSERYEKTISHWELEFCVHSASGIDKPRFRWEELRLIGEQCIPQIRPLPGQMVVMDSARYISITIVRDCLRLELKNGKDSITIEDDCLSELWKAGQEYLFPFNDRERKR